MPRQFIELDGADDFYELVVRAGRNAPKLIGRGVYEQALAVFRESQKQVPVRTGALRATGIVDPPQISTNGIEVTIAYGGPAAPYAMIVHEGHASHDSPTKAKYLEDPVLAAMPDMAQKISDTVRRLLRK